MLNRNTVAVALVQGQVALVQATRDHAPSECWLDVYVYHPLGNRVFFTRHSLLPAITPSDSLESFDSWLDKCTPPKARIASKDLLKVFPDAEYGLCRADAMRAAERGLLELPLQAYLEYAEIVSSNEKKMDKMWGQWHKQAKPRVNLNLNLRLRFGGRAR